MEDGRQYFEERAAQCRRLAQSVGDTRTSHQLSELALEFDAKARDAGPRESAERAASQDSPDA
jgi:hypothetical protein